MEKSTENPGRDTELLDISGELRGENNYRNKNVAGISLQTFVKLGNQLISSRECVCRGKGKRPTFAKFACGEEELLIMKTEKQLARKEKHQKKLVPPNVCHKM